MGHRFGPPFLERQTRLGTIQRLNLALFVAAKHQGMIRRRHVQSYDVFEFLDEPRIARHLEGLDQVRLEAVGLPYFEHSGIRNAEFGGQLARTPVGSALRLGLRRHADNFRRVDRRFASATRQIGFNGLHATCGKSITPRDHLSATDFKSPCNLVITNPLGGKQHNPRAPDAACIQRLRPHPALQFDSLLISQRDRRTLIH